MQRHSWEWFSQLFKVVKNHEDLTLKQMFDVTAQLVNNQDEINDLDKILWEKYAWKHLSLIGDETVINVQRTEVYVFSDSVLCFGKVLQHPECNEVWKNRVAGVRAERNYKDYDAINGESTEFEWNIFPGFTTLQLCDKISDFLSSMGLQKNLELVNGHFIGPGSEKKVVSFRKQSTRSPGQHCGRHVAGIRRKWTSYSPCNDSIVQGSVEKQRTRKVVHSLHC